MIEDFITSVLVFCMVYCLYRGVYDLIFCKVDYNNLENSHRECPECQEHLYVEYGKFASVYRCKECEFEGIREPLVYGIAQACVRVEKYAKQYVNRKAEK